MTNQMYKISHLNPIILQWTILTFSILWIVSIFWDFVNNFSFSYFFVLLIHIFVIGYLNKYSLNLYEVKIKEKNILLFNYFLGNKSYNIEDFQRIESVLFAPGQFVIYFKDSKRYRFYGDIFVTLEKKLSGKDYPAELTKEILHLGNG
jgi:hypothetical protein